MQKTNFKTRLLALLTAAFMLVMCVPFAAFADSSEHETSTVLWTTRDGQQLHKDTVSKGKTIEAPEIEEGYVWSDTDYANKTYKPGDKISFADMEANISYWSQGEGSYAFRKIDAPKPATKTVYVSYILESGAPLDAEIEKIELKADATTFSTSLLKKVPAGYELCADGDVYIGTSDTVNVKVREAKKTVFVSYILENGEPLANAIEQIELAAGATTFSTSLLKKVPTGYELCETGDVYIGTNDTVNVKVREAKKPAKVVYVSYILESGEPLANAIEKIELENGATTFNTSVLKQIPVGYELCETGDVYIGENDTVNVKVRKPAEPAVKEVKINFYCPEEKKQVAEPTVVVNADATCVNSSAYASMVPAGYELVEVGDMPIRDGYVYAEVRKVATKTIKINYYSEEEEKQIAEVEMTVPADATYVNTSKLTAPAGYELVLAGDLPIRDGYVYAAVRKVPTTTIKISYVDEATDKEVGTEDLVVNQGSTVVNFNVLKSVPAGYELCESGDFYVGNGSAKVMVRKTKSNNGSSSSSSASSNKTTTASNEKQVVKAAAAPANTTKVLPKTGASNVAPLLGGSLAVVALLMGYGVYGLVLRKKD